MSKRLTGRNPLAYIGVESLTPPSTYVFKQMDPNPNDRSGFDLGDMWLNVNTKTLWVLAKLANGQATWITTFGAAASSFKTDDGNTATDVGGVINIFGDGQNTNTSSSGNTVSVNLDPNLTISNLKLTGIGIEGVVQTDASGNLFANNGTNGQVLIGGGTHPVWADVVAGSNINIVNGANSITISASGAGGGGATTFLTDINSPASETGGDITFAGGNNIQTSGITPNTVTLSLVGTTNHAVQVGNSTGSLTSLALATDGEVLTGVSGGSPIFAALNAGVGIDIATGPGSITITNTGGGGGGGGLIRTPFFAASGTQTWTKNVATKYVEVWGWCAGGGGGSGGAGQGGAGGGSGSFFRFKGPAEFFGATELVVVGFGGTGGASVTTGNGNDGTNGGVSSFGNITVPLVANNIAVDSTLTLPLLQAGAGGGGFKQIGIDCGYSGGVFTDDAGMVYNASNLNVQYGVPQPNTRANTIGDSVKGGGAGGISTGIDGLSTGGLLIFSPVISGAQGPNSSYGIPGRGSFGFVYMLGTSGGQGGSTSGGNYYNGGKGGTVFAFDTTTVLSAGGAAGVAGISTPGANGRNSIDPSSGLSGSGGLVFGGTGGGGGASDPNNGGSGGDGGFPGGGAGGGGSATSGRPSGIGGDGADGFVLVLEWT
jgi:hypothetical protein